MEVAGDDEKIKWTFYHSDIKKNNNFQSDFASIKSIHIYSSFKKKFQNGYTFAQLLFKNTTWHYIKKV